MFVLAKRIIDAVNKRNKKQLEAELSSLTGLELMLLLKGGYKFLLPDIFRVMEQSDVELEPARDVPERSKPTVLCPIPNSERNESIRTVSLDAGSSPVGNE